MQEYLIGTGGWAYFRVPGTHSLVSYSHAFDFVEVNSTFYTFPSMRQVEKWRNTVPEDFDFGVRAHRIITHKNRMRPTPEAIAAIEKMKDICKALKAQTIHIQVPSGLELSSDVLERFLKSGAFGDLRIALETRSYRDTKLPSDLVRTMKEGKVIHTVDFSKGETPAYSSDILYTRLFGRGEHNVYEPTDDELAQIDSKARQSGSEKVKMSFHFVKMYKDAARLKIYRQTGRFPSVTRSKGYSSLNEVLKEDATFPSSKEHLIRKQGWKLFDVDSNKRMRVSDILGRLPEADYESIEDVIGTLHSQHAIE